MKIYTKTGDKGETGLFGGERVPKDSLRIEAYGTVDELNAAVGIVRANNADAEFDLILRRIQNDLFVLGADLAAPRANEKVPHIGAAHIADLEKFIDLLNSDLPPLNAFILPAGTPAACSLHLARTISRRAERRVVHLMHSEDIGENILIYLNRLSDLLFVLARFANHLAKMKDDPWTLEREK